MKVIRESDSASYKQHFQGVLFPEAERYNGREELLEYLERELVNLARARSLSVTDLLNLPRRLRTYCGHIIAGIYVERDSLEMRTDTQRVPEELANYQVTIRSCDGARTIKWKSRMAPKRTRSNAAGCKVQLYESEFIDTENTEHTFPLPTAWKILHIHGKFCSPIGSERLRAKRWIYEEVPPVSTVVPVPERPQRERREARA